MKQEGHPLVLCVDREQSMLDVVDARLTDYGFSVITALTAHQALAQASRALPSLIVMDLDLPDMGGLELLKQLKENSVTAHIPVIILTVGQEKPVMDSALELGADDCLKKPFSIDVLATRVKTMLDRLRRRNLLMTLINGPLIVDKKKQEAFLNGERMSLETREFKLLCELIENSGRTLTEEHLTARLWGFDYFVDHYAVYVQFKRLQAKLGEYGWLIEAIHKDKFRMILYADENR